MAEIEGEAVGAVLSPIAGTSDATIEEIIVPPEVRQHAAEILKKKPKKGILKSSSSLDQTSPQPQSQPSGGAVSDTSDHKFERLPSCKGESDKDRAHFDEMNIMATLHPVDKEYGHMKIDEPKTPYNYQSDSEAEDNPPSERVRRVSLSEHRKGVDAESLSDRLSGDSSPKLLHGSPDEEDSGPETEEMRAKRKHFEMKRKMHYNEAANIKLAKQLMEKDEEEDDAGDQLQSGDSMES